MSSRLAGRRMRRGRTVLYCAAALVSSAATVPAQSANPDTTVDQLKTASPIKHVIVVIGENRTFDHIYGTYAPKSGDTILNLLSERIVRKDGSPGPNFGAA